MNISYDFSNECCEFVDSLVGNMGFEKASSQIIFDGSGTALQAVVRLVKGNHSVEYDDLSGAVGIYRFAKGQVIPVCPKTKYFSDANFAASFIDSLIEGSNEEGYHVNGH